MNDSPNLLWLDAASETLGSYRRMINATVAQLSDEELHARPAPNVNSVAVILRHLGGNLQSRWTDFLTTDGEKPSRDRDAEFQDWQGSREGLWEYFEEGWRSFAWAISVVDNSNIEKPVYIRGERHTLPQAITRSLTHVAYHTGQIAIVARMVHQGEWKWLTIAPGQSQQHNQQTGDFRQS